MNFEKNTAYNELQTRLSGLSNYFYSLNMDLNHIINYISIRYSNDELSLEEITSAVLSFEKSISLFNYRELNFAIDNLKKIVGKRSYGNLSFQEKIWIYQDYLTGKYSQKQLSEKYLTYQKAIYLTLQEFQNSYNQNPFK